MKAPQSYAEAQAELNQLLLDLQQPDAAIDLLAERVTRAKHLIDWSREKLRTTDAEVQKLLSEDR